MNFVIKYFCYLTQLQGLAETCIDAAEYLNYGREVFYFIEIAKVRDAPSCLFKNVIDSNL